MTKKMLKTEIKALSQVADDNAKARSQADVQIRGLEEKCAMLIGFLERVDKVHKSEVDLYEAKIETLQTIITAQRAKIDLLVKEMHPNGTNKKAV